MSLGFALLLVTLASAPIDFFWAWPGLLGLRLMLVGASFCITLKGLSQREYSILAGTTRTAVFGFTIIIVWTLFQLVPVGTFPHPFWESAASALDASMKGAISVDLGATVLAIARIFLGIALLLLSAMFAIDRRRAEWVLLSLLLIAGLVLESFVFGVILPSWLGLGPPQAVNNDLLTFAKFSLVLSVTAAIFGAERFESQRDRSILKLVLQEIGCAFVFVVASLVLLQPMDPAVVFVAVTGFSIPLIILLVRRTNLGLILGGIVALVSVIACVALVGTKTPRSNDPLLAFSSSSASDHVLEITRRMEMDAPWAGTGAGTFQALRPIYQSAAEPSSTVLATGWAVLAVELGNSVFWIIIGVTIVLLIGLVRGALRRGRDFFFPAAGAGCLSVILLNGFMNAGIFAAPNYLFASAILGLALAQTSSRT